MKRIRALSLLLAFCLPLVLRAAEGPEAPATSPREVLSWPEVIRKLANKKRPPGRAKLYHFRQLIPSIQPVVLYGSNKYKGLFRLFDGSERCPAVHLDFDGDWLLRNNPGMVHGLGLDKASNFRKFLFGSGVTYYNPLRAKLDGRDYLVHQFWYYFPVGEAEGGEYLNGFNLVEIYQRIDPGPDELATYRREVQGDLQRYRTELDRQLLTARGARRREVESLLTYVKKALARKDRQIPLNYFFRWVYTAGPMPIGGVPCPFRYWRYPRDQVRWVGLRPTVYVTENTHRFLCRREDLGDEECDPPYEMHPDAGGRLIDLRNPTEPKNPLLNNAIARALGLKGQFAEHPVFHMGIPAYLRWKKAGGKIIRAVP